MSQPQVEALYGGMVYAGIGSRETPPAVQQQMAELAARLDKLGCVLRSGGAEGADTAFELAASNVPPEIYIPWANAIRDKNKQPIHWRNQRAIVAPDLPAWPLALDAAEKHHPNWPACSVGARKLLARNSMQILGRDMRTPADFVVCWTKNGGPSGGTGQALRLASHEEVPVYNLFWAEHWAELERLLAAAGA